MASGTLPGVLLRTSLVVPVDALSEELAFATSRTPVDGESAAQIVVTEPFLDPDAIGVAELDALQALVAPLRPFRVDVGPVTASGGAVVHVPVSAERLDLLVAAAAATFGTPIGARAVRDLGAGHVLVDKVTSARRLSTLVTSLQGRFPATARVGEMRLVLHSPVGARTAIRFPFNRKRWVAVRSLDGPGGPLRTRRR